MKEQAITGIIKKLIPKEFQPYITRAEKIRTGTQKHIKTIVEISGDTVEVCQRHQEKENFAVIASCILANIPPEKITEELKSLEELINRTGSDNQKLLIVVINYILKGN